MIFENLKNGGYWSFETKLYVIRDICRHVRTLLARDMM